MYRSASEPVNPVTGVELPCSAGLCSIATLMLGPSSIALPQLATEGLIAGVAFVDGSHRFHAEPELFGLEARCRTMPGGVQPEGRTSRRRSSSENPSGAPSPCSRCESSDAESAG